MPVIVIILLLVLPWAAAGHITASVLDGAALIMAADYSDSSC